MFRSLLTVLSLLCFGLVAFSPSYAEEEHAGKRSTRRPRAEKKEVSIESPFELRVTDEEILDSLKGEGQKHHPKAIVKDVEITSFTYETTKGCKGSFDASDLKKASFKLRLSVPGKPLQFCEAELVRTENGITTKILGCEV
jgi:hypothetical protein